MKKNLSFFIPIWIFKKNPIYISIMTAMIIFGYLKDKENINLNDYNRNECCDSYVNIFEDNENNININKTNFEEKYLMKFDQYNNIKNIYTNELSSKIIYNFIIIISTT